MRDRRYFTCVFEGDVRTLEKNPFQEQTPYGRCVAIGVGNAFDDIPAEAVRIINEWGDDNGLDLGRLAKTIKDQC